MQDLKEKMLAAGIITQKTYERIEKEESKKKEKRRKEDCFSVEEAAHLVRSLWMQPLPSDEFSEDIVDVVIDKVKESFKKD